MTRIDVEYTIADHGDVRISGLSSLQVAETLLCQLAQHVWFRGGRVNFVNEQAAGAAEKASI